MKKFFNFSVIFFTVSLLYSCNFLAATGIIDIDKSLKKVETTLNATVKISEITIDHSQWDKLLKKHVDKNGFVDYTGFAKDALALNSYIEMLSKNQPNSDWSVRELLAYYINLYNAVTIKLIVENYPVKSIKDISRPWSKNRVIIGGEKHSLNDIEHSILRKMNEPRIHFALNCASISCPKLSNEAYTASKIDEQLDRAAKEFINSDKNDLSASNAKLSSIFDWYQKDFKVNGNTNVIAFINQYSDVKVNINAKISFIKYDWNLNEQ